MKIFIIGFISLFTLFGCSQQVTISNNSPSSQITQTTVQNSNTEENSQATTSIKFFAEKNPLKKSYQSIQYVGHEPNPDNGVMSEKYDADGDTYLLYGSMVNQFMDKDINVSERKPMGSKIYTQQELEAITKEFIKNNTLVDFTQLTPNFGQKGDNYFFAWEYRKNGKTDEMIYPRVQVGIRKDGWLFSYEDILNY